MKSSASALPEVIRKVGSSNVVVLTGAGCSTESGIPDYRGPHGRYRRPDFVPLTFQNFMSNDFQKKRYWTRSMLGYSVMLGASCNATHMSLYNLQEGGVVSHIITQNVDGLHHLATYGGKGTTDPDKQFQYTSSRDGSEGDLTEIHGNIHEVICVKCKHVISRAMLQQRLELENKELFEHQAINPHLMQPDGDYLAPDELVESMKLVYCEKCGGHLKPHVVLFGENVPKDLVHSSLDIVKQSSCLLCIGTSLQVFSAFRYVLAAKEKDIPVVIVNNGQTRADGKEDLKIHTESVASVMSHTASVLLNE